MKRIAIQSEKIKWFALLAMTADHIDRILIHTEWLSDTLGRMAFPIFSYLLMSNFCVYHQTKKYILRLGIFGVLTQLVLFHFDQTNVLFSFLWAILFLAVVEKVCQMTKSFFIQAYLSVLLFLSLSPIIMKADYNVVGFFFLISLYAYFKNKTKLNYFAVLFISIMINYQPIIAAFSSFSITLLFLSFAQIKRSKRLAKWWFFYVYYPLHRLFLYSLKILLGV